MESNSKAKKVGCGLVLLVLWASVVSAQHTNVEVAKRSRAIPRACERLTPANIEGSIDVPALVKEAICKGAGDMLAEYTYRVNSLKREKDKKGKVKDETFIYEVFIPTLKGGTHAKGILIVTSHNGVAVPPPELEKARLQAAEKIEKEESRIAASKPTATPESEPAPGMLPLGMYTRTTFSRSAFGMKSGGMTLAIADFLRSSDLTLARREQVAGRDTLIFNFTPRSAIEFIENEKYMAALTGEIWIDAADRIVTRLVGWPASEADAKSEIDQTLELIRAGGTAVGGRVPAVYVEMMRLPQPGIWLPHVIHVNGADHPSLFNGIKTISTSTYSNYIRFSTEVKDAEVEAPKTP